MSILSVNQTQQAPSLTQRQAPAAYMNTRLAQVHALCADYFKGFVSPQTGLAYGARINGPKGLDALESLAQVHARTVRGEYRPWGYGSGIEDLAYHNGMLLYALCDAQQATQDVELRHIANRVCDALLHMATLSPKPGFVPRGPHPADGVSYYPDSSLDQHTLFVCGLWRYARSPMATIAQIKTISQVVINILTRFEAQNWAFLDEAGINPAHAGGDMLKLDAERSIVLLVMLKIAHDLSGDAHWLELYEQFGSQESGLRWRKIAEQPNLAKPRRYNMFNNQDVLRTETLRRLESNPQRKAQLANRLTAIAADMMTCAFSHAFGRVFLASEKWEAPHHDDQIANEYLAPLGESVTSRSTLLDLWHKFDMDRVSPPMQGMNGRRNHYEPITLATPAMTWQVAFLSRTPPWMQQAEIAVQEMFQRVDFTRIDLGWAFNYSVTAGLWSLCALDQNWKP